MAPFEFCAPQRIVFGWGRRDQAGELAAGLGRRAWVVLGSRTLKDRGIYDELAADLRRGGVESHLAAAISREPEADDVDNLVRRLRADATTSDLILALGGGSALDLAKAAAALVTNRHGDSVRDFLEGVGKGLKITEPPLPVLAMPTTGGTGTEATRNAVITSYDPPFKKSLRSPRMVPPVVLVDPELSVSVPATTTAYTGMDAITQCIESYVCRFATPMTQALAISGLRSALPRVVEAVRDGSSRPAREAMSYAALVSGMALANSGLGLAHGVAAALGASARVAHGLACAVMLPAALRLNLAVAQKPLAELAQFVLDIDEPIEDNAAQRFVDHVQGLCVELGIPQRLSAVGVRREQLDDLVRGSRGSSMNGNPRQLSDPELRDLLEAML